MEANLCPKTPSCKLFNDNLLKRKDSAEVYKNLFCRAGDSKYVNCKRYMVSERTGKCPGSIMPNSTYSIDEIVEQMKKSGEL